MSPSGSQFNPAHFNFAVEKRKIAREIVLECLKKVIQISNSSLIRIRNTDHHMSKMDVESTVQWVGKIKSELTLANIIYRINFRKTISDRNLINNY